MADQATEATSKLQLDEETGEMISKNEFKKRAQKRAKKAVAAARTRETAADQNHEPSPAPAQEPGLLDLDAMFRQGWLADVYKERASREVVTRFPPEPNGYLHLGHVKAIAVNFGFARFHNGRAVCFEPSAVTYTSDHFQRLYEMAENLIQLGKAYVCHCDPAETKKQRGGKDGKEGPRYRCEHAEQDAANNLRKFRDMRDGVYKHQEAFLRMKQDIENPNPQMWDLVAYRIPCKAHHHRTKDRWKIYPTYDFAHCLCDSFEGITHSLCTTEFFRSRESYEWLNRTLGVYEPIQREFGRFNIDNTVMSKRAVNELVEKKIVRGRDDPRLYTLVALRRRGVPPGAILAFINELGVTTAKTTTQTARFEQSVRRFLEASVPRLMLVLDPVPLVIDGVEGLAATEIEVPFSTRDPSMGSRALRLTRTVYVDRSDFREVADDKFFRLAPGRTVGLLKFPSPITVTTFTKDGAGQVSEIRAVLDSAAGRPKAYIQWVPEGSAKVEVRVHGRLFKSDDPNAAPGGFLQDVDPHGETVYHSAMIEAGFEKIRRSGPWPREAGRGQTIELDTPESIRFQAMRAIDSDSTAEHIVLNRIVSLKADAGKD
ncbi:Glutaminyl-tRNA synthetase [Diaporthe amygdali]|uniref:Glutaminyl-tRNA synthetase n=1 Tax=Phomopsis amygdali TaxID=1214568 RepID=UPI0022FDD17C|nr:Glutaminyl-tRNA synthetase [Diaporthe amygdali]KAJ0109004.1 Glutaminyl-tRNA synthetase [Diaporthe amygdali]